MRSPDWKDKLLAEHRAHLRTEEARQGFDAFVALGQKPGGCSIAPQRHGEVRSLSFEDPASGDRLYGCVVNQRDLLFVVRPRGQSRVRGGFRNLKEQFGWAHESAGDWSVRIRTADEARQLIALLYRTEPEPREPATDTDGSGSWWVNHPQAHVHDFAGECLWSPKANRNGSQNESYVNMTRARPGDTVFSSGGGELRAIGVVLEEASEALRPPGPDKVDDGAVREAGWQLPVRFLRLDRPLRLKEYASELAAVLPKRYSPIRASGDINPAVYLARVPPAMLAVLERLLDGQLERGRADIGLYPGGDWADAAAQTRIEQRRDLLPSRKLQLVKARRGQGEFRRNVEQVEHGCRLTKVLDRRHLLAAHIKPWRLASDAEKLDGCNGLLFAPHVHHLFERGYISFADDGTLLVSRGLNPSVLAAWGIELPLHAGAFRPEQQLYLVVHREQVFGRHDGGRRTSAT